MTTPEEFAQTEAYVPPYRWVITRDRDYERYGASDATLKSSVGIEGPYGASETVNDNGEKWTLWDDDGECIYEGMIYGNFSGFEPLDDYGMPNFGCTAIKMPHHITGKMEYV